MAAVSKYDIFGWGKDVVINKETPAGNRSSISLKDENIYKRLINGENFKQSELRKIFRNHKQ